MESVYSSKSVFVAYLRFCLPALRFFLALFAIAWVFFGISSPAAVILYWLVGGIFSIIQQLITNYIIKPRLKEKVAEEFKKNPTKAPRTTPNKRKDVTPKNTQAIGTSYCRLY